MTDKEGFEKYLQTNNLDLFVQELFLAIYEQKYTKKKELEETYGRGRGNSPQDKQFVA